MNGRGAGMAAVAGVITILFYFLGGVILFFAVASSINPIMGAASELSPAAKVTILAWSPPCSSWAASSRPAPWAWDGCAP